MSSITTTNTELIYASQHAATAKASFTSEVQINDTAGMGAQAFIPANFWAPMSGGAATGKAIRIVARGIVSSTSTPTYTFTIRAGTAGNTSSAILAGSAAITTASSITNKGWELEADIVLETLGAAGTNSTVRGAGFITSPAGFASPFQYEIWGGASQPGTVATLDTTIVNYINFNLTCSANSSSNSIQLLQLLVFGLN
jgi:hypothetical protein